MMDDREKDGEREKKKEGVNGDFMGKAFRAQSKDLFFQVYLFWSNKIYLRINRVLDFGWTQRPDSNQHE